MKQNQKLIYGIVALVLWLTTAQTSWGFYNSQTGRWLNRDPLAEKGGLNVYCFVGNNPVGATDRDGRITVRTLTHDATTICGNFDVYWNFILDHPAAEDGYIVQKVTYIENYEFCRSSMKLVVKPAEPRVYWEAWLVKAGHQFPTGQGNWKYSDNGWDNSPGKTKGSRIQSGEIKFFFAKNKTGNLGDPGANPVIPSDPNTGFSGPNDWSGALPTCAPPGPDWWNGPSDNGEADASRSASLTWDCCCPSCPIAKNPVKVTP